MGVSLIINEFFVVKIVYAVRLNMDIFTIFLNESERLLSRVSSLDELKIINYETYNFLINFRIETSIEEKTADEYFGILLF